MPGGALAGPTGCEPVSGSCRPGKAQPPPGEIKDTVPDILPGGAALAGPTGCEPVNGSCRPGKAQPPPGNTTGTVPDYCPAALRLYGPKRQPDSSLSLRERARVREALQCCCLCYRWLQRSLRSRLIVCVMSFMAQGAHRGRPVAAAPVPPGSGQQHRRCAVPSTYPCRLRVGPRQRPCKTRPSARIHAGCPGLPGTSQRC